MSKLLDPDVDRLILCLERYPPHDRGNVRHHAMSLPCEAQLAFPQRYSEHLEGEGIDLITSGLCDAVSIVGHEASVHLQLRAGGSPLHHVAWSSDHGTWC